MLSNVVSRSTVAELEATTLDNSRAYGVNRVIASSAMVNALFCPAVMPLNTKLAFLVGSASSASIKSVAVLSVNVSVPVVVAILVPTAGATTSRSSVAPHEALVPSVVRNLLALPV